MKALVTGAAGFIGSTLSDRLVEQDVEVVGVDCFLDYYPRATKQRNLAGLAKNSAFRFVEADLVTADLESLTADVDFVFHQAAQAGVRSSWGEDFRIYSDNNVFATQRLLEACRVASNLKKFVYASSSSIYGDAESLPTHEDTVPGPLSPYGVSKLAGEHLVRLYHINNGLPTASLRYFTVYGPRQRPDMAFNRFMRAAIEDREISLYGDGEQSRDFTFVGDIVAANIAAANSDANGEAFNVGGGSRVTVNEVLATISRIAGRTLRVNRMDAQKGDVRHTGADTSRAAAAFAYKPKVGLEEGLAREYAWLAS